MGPFCNIFLACRLTQHPYLHNCPNFFYRKTGLHLPGSRRSALYKLGIAPATHKTYDAALRKFTSFCKTFRILNPFPLSQDTLCNFVAFLARQNIKQTTLKVYLSALRYYQVGQGFTEPNHAAMAKLKTVGNGMKRLQAASTLNRKNRLPITPELLRQIRHQWENKAQEYEVIMFWAVCCTAFFGFFRLGEILLPSGCTYDSNIHLSVGDVAVDSIEDPKMVQVSLKHSKTDQFGQGSKFT